MRYKWFEIVPAVDLAGNIEPNRYQVIWWEDEPEGSDSKEYYFAIAEIYWNPDELQWEFKSYGTRFFTFYQEGLVYYIGRFIDSLDDVREGEENS